MISGFIRNAFCYQIPNQLQDALQERTNSVQDTAPGPAFHFSSHILELVRKTKKITDARENSNGDGSSCIIDTEDNSGFSDEDDDVFTDDLVPEKSSHYFESSMNSAIELPVAESTRQDDRSLNIVREEDFSNPDLQEISNEGESEIDVVDTDSDASSISTISESTSIDSLKKKKKRGRIPIASSRLSYSKRARLPSDPADSISQILQPSKRTVMVQNVKLDKTKAKARKTDPKDISPSIIDDYCFPSDQNIISYLKKVPMTVIMAKIESILKHSDPDHTPKTCDNLGLGHLTTDQRNKLRHVGFNWRNSSKNINDMKYADQWINCDKKVKKRRVLTKKRSIKIWIMLVFCRYQIVIMFGLRSAAIVH